MFFFLILLYRPIVEFFVRFRMVSVFLSLGLFVMGILVFRQMGSEFTPKLKEGTIVVRLTMAPSISLEESTQTTLRVEERVVALPEVKEVVTRIGRGEVGAHSDPINSAEMYVLLEDKSKWRKKGSQEYIEELLREELDNIRDKKILIVKIDLNQKGRKYKAICVPLSCT